MHSIIGFSMMVVNCNIKPGHKGNNSQYKDFLVWYNRKDATAKFWLLVSEQLQLLKKFFWYCQSIIGHLCKVNAYLMHNLFCITQLWLIYSSEQSWRLYENWHQFHVSYNLARTAMQLHQKRQRDTIFIVLSLPQKTDTVNIQEETDDNDDDDADGDI